MHSACLNAASYDVTSGACVYTMSHGVSLRLTLARSAASHLYCDDSTEKVSLGMYDVSATKCAAPGTSHE